MLTSLGYLLILACSVLLNGDQFGPIVNRFEEKYSELLDENVNYPDEQYPDVPLQIVRPDSLHKKLVVVEKNLKFLNNIKEPVTIISVAGKFHSGKSFLMNQLMSKSNGFGIGSQVTPKTMGIWMWGKPMKIEDSSFNGWLLFLDTEGFAANNVSENYDAKIFAVSTLLSSQLLYNSVKIIDQSDVDYLELLARRTQLFALKAHMSPKKNWTSDFSTQLLQFPSLIWVIQDFVQETNGEACREWLLKLLSTHTRETEAYDISLKDIFPHVDCHTLFIPCAKKDLLTDLSLTTDADLIEEYKLERNQLLAKIKSNIEPKMRNNQPFTGADVAMLLRVLVDAANSGSLTDIPNRWETFLDKLQKSSVEECFKFYQSCMDFFVTEQNRNEAVNGGDLKETHSRSKAKTLNLLHHLLTGLEKSIGKSKQELFEKIDNSFSIISQLNEQKIEMKIFNLKKSYELKISDSFLTLKLPRLSSEIGQFGNGLEKEYTQAFVSDLTYLVGKEKLSNEVKSLSEFVSLNIDSTKMKNFQILEKKFDEIIANIDAEVIGSAQVNTETPFTFKRLEEYVSKLMQKTVSSFKNEASEYIAEKSVYDGKFYQLVTGINEKIALFRADNVNAVRQFLFKQADSFLEDFNRQTEQSRANFPMRFEDLDSFLERKFHKTKTIFATDFKDYSDYPVFADAIDKLNKEIEKICGSRRGENLQAFKLEVEQPLAFAKKSILLSKSKYSSLFCFRKFIIDSSLLHLNEGKAKNWPLNLKQKIIDSFVEDDAELAEQIRLRQTFFSKLFSFFMWLFSFFTSDPC